MNWKLVIKYATTLFIAQFILGFFEGLLFERSVSVTFGSHAASLVVCGAIFLHLGIHESFKPFVHAWAIFVVEVVAAWVLVLILYPWLGAPDFTNIVFDYIVGVFALAAGTSLGILLRKKAKLKA